MRKQHKASAVQLVEKLLGCVRCGYQWFAKVDNPVACPSCKSYLWNVPRNKTTMTNSNRKETR